MAKTKINFESNKKKGRSLKESGVIIDSAQINVRNKKIDVSKEELYGELARDWALADYWADKIAPKRQIRVLQKALTAPAFEDNLIPLRSTDSNEAAYFMALMKVKDTVLFIQDLMYDEMFSAEEQRRIAEEQEKAHKKEKENAEQK